MDAVSEYKRRRADRLAVRGIRPKEPSNMDWPLEVTAFTTRRNKRLIERGINDPFRMDAPGDEDEGNNNQSGGGSESSGGHGNTKLPFGLCKRFGIEIGADWTPRDAWDALAGKGITADGAYARLKKGEDPGASDKEATPEVAPGVPAEPKKSVNVEIGFDDYKVSGAEKVDDGDGKLWKLKGTVPGYPDDEIRIASFDTKREMLEFLKEQGVEEFPDPETGEIINPKEMELPKVTTLMGDGFYKGMEFGDLTARKPAYVSRGSEPWVVTGKAVGVADPYLSRLHRFWTKEDLMYWLRDKGVEEVFDPETGEKVNPQELELPEKLGMYDGAGIRALSLGMKGDRYAVTMTMLDGKKKTIRDFPSFAMAKQYATESLGIGEDKIKMSPALKKREAERAAWKTSDKKEYVEQDGKKYGDLRIKEEDGYYGGKWALYAEGEDGEEYSWRFGTKAQAIKFLKEQGVERAKDGKEFISPVEQEIPETMFTRGNTDYQKAVLKKDRWGDDLYFYGVDLDGNEVILARSHSRMTADEFFEKIKEKYGIDESQLEMSDDVKSAVAQKREADAERERIRKEFEARSMPFGSYRYADPVLKVDRDGDYYIEGADKDGDKLRISGWGDLYDMEEFCTRYGYNLQQFVKDDAMRDAVNDYLEAKKDFDEKKVSLPGGEFVSPKIEYRGGLYRLRGTDRRGRVHDLLRTAKFSELEEGLKPFGFTGESFPADDEAKAHIESAKKVKDLVATGEWYDMGSGEEAYKDLYAQKDDTGWKIVGTSSVGGTRVVSSVDTWDEAIGELESRGVKEYKVRSGGKEFGMPSMGMHGVVLMRKPGGGFAVQASTRDKPRDTVFTAETEEEARKWLRDNNVPDGGIKTRGMNPNDDVPRKHTQKSLDGFDAKRMEKIEGTIVDDLSLEQKNEAASMLTEMFDKGAYKVFRSADSMFGILTDRYKSQPEVGHGGASAADNPKLRKKLSKDIFGHGEIEDRDYEKCGYLGFSDDVEDWKSSTARGYGGTLPVMYTFKKDRMNDRLTYTYGDSLNQRYAISTAGYGGPNPTLEGLTALDHKAEIEDAINVYRRYKAGELSYNDFFNRAKRDADNRYIELQYHGDVTADDIERISFRRSADMMEAFNNMSDERRKRVFGVLRDKKIPVYYVENGKLVDAAEELNKRYEAGL